MQQGPGRRAARAAAGNAEVTPVRRPASAAAAGSASPREVLVLRGIEQEPTRTVAVILEITPAAVDQRYSRALKRLRELMPDSVFAELQDG